MAKKIQALTKDQEARFSEWRDKWIAIGLSTERADWEEFEKQAKDCYRFSGLNPNVPIIHVSSPMVGADIITPREAFFNSWDSVYPGSWDRNDWVWVIEFKRIK